MTGLRKFGCVLHRVPTATHPIGLRTAGQLLCVHGPVLAPLSMALSFSTLQWLLLLPLRKPLGGLLALLLNQLVMLVHQGVIHLIDYLSCRFGPAPSCEDLRWHMLGLRVVVLILAMGSWFRGQSWRLLILLLLLVFLRDEVVHGIVLLSSVVISRVLYGWRLIVVVRVLVLRGYVCHIGSENHLVDGVEVWSRLAGWLMDAGLGD